MKFPPHNFSITPWHTVLRVTNHPNQTKLIYPLGGQFKMKKTIAASILSLLLITSGSQAFAANAVSTMATAKGGQAVAACAQTMERGVSVCAQHDVCEMAE